MVSRPLNVIFLFAALFAEGFGASYNESFAKDAMLYASAAYCSKASVTTWGTQFNSACEERTDGFEVRLKV